MNTGFYKENTIESKPWGFRFQWRLHMFKPYEKNIICFSEESWTLASPKKVGSKPERCERVYKRAAKAQRDLFRRGDAAKWARRWLLLKKSPQAIWSLRRRGTDVHNQPKIYIENPAENSHISPYICQLIHFTNYGSRMPKFVDWLPCIILRNS